MAAKNIINVISVLTIWYELGVRHYGQSTGMESANQGKVPARFSQLGQSIGWRQPIKTQYRLGFGYPGKMPASIQPFRAK